MPNKYESYKYRTRLVNIHLGKVAFCPLDIHNITILHRCISCKWRIFLAWPRRIPHGSTSPGCLGFIHCRIAYGLPMESLHIGGVIRRLFKILFLVGGLLVETRVVCQFCSLLAALWWLTTINWLNKNSNNPGGSPTKSCGWRDQVQQVVWNWLVGFRPC